MLIGRSQSKAVPDFLTTAKRQQSRKSKPQRDPSRTRDTYTPSLGAKSEKNSNLAKTVLLTAVGAAIGAGIAALSLPLAGALLVGGGVGAIAGAAIGQGALTETGGTYDPHTSNPYTDAFHTDSPLNPLNPNFWED